MIKVIALDLEGTLISNAMSQIPRPGLYDFLENCYSICKRTVMFTTVKETKFRDIAKLLVTEKLAPKWFSDIEYIHWEGKTKDLTFIKGVELYESLLVDDYEIYIHPGQETQWIQIKQFDHPYPDSDNELELLIKLLRKKIEIPIDQF